MQVVHDVSFKNCHVAVNPGLMENNFLKKLDSIIIYSNAQAHDEDPKCHKLLELVQIDGKRQVKSLIENEMYSTAMKICDFLINKNYERLSQDEYQNFQKGRTFYCFFVKKDYKLCISLLKKVNVPPEEVILLFADLYPKVAIDQMIERFDINIKEIPYLNDQQSVYSPVVHSLKIDHSRKRTVSFVNKKSLRKGKPFANNSMLNL